jgi:hypothetical protein
MKSSHSYSVLSLIVLGVLFCNLRFEYIGLIYTALAHIHVYQKKEMDRPEQGKRNLKRAVQQCGT